MKRRSVTVPIITAIVAVSILLLASYMGAYYALLMGKTLGSGYVGATPVVNGILMLRTEPAYRVEGIAPLFTPAHAIDRQLRPAYWNDPSDAFY